MEILIVYLVIRKNIMFQRRKEYLSKCHMNIIQKSNVELVTIDNSGHFPMLDNPKDVSKVIQNLINDLE